MRPVRTRPRTQVGTTNRWRFPESSGGDLLGTSQAVKSVPSLDDASNGIVIYPRGKIDHL